MKDDNQALKMISCRGVSGFIMGSWLGTIPTSVSAALPLAA